jgi:hypothetical protein
MVTESSLQLPEEEKQKNAKNKILDCSYRYDQKSYFFKQAGCLLAMLP